MTDATTENPAPPASASRGPTAPPDAPGRSPSRPSFLRYLLTPRYLLGPLVFLLIRLDVGAYWAWGDYVKTPWNDWGCAAKHSFCETGYLKALPTFLPDAMRPFVNGYVLPHLVTIEWTTFILEVVIATLLLAGLFGRFAALLGTVWAVFVSGTYAFTPGTWAPDPLLFLLGNLALLTVRGGGILTLDSILYPRLVASPSRWIRQLGYWMWPRVPDPSA